MICTTGKPYCIFQESVVSLLWYIDGGEGLILITRTSERVTFYGKRVYGYDYGRDHEMGGSIFVGPV